MIITATVTNDLTYDQRMIRICTSLAKAGHQVELVGRKRTNSLPFRKQTFQQKRLGCWFEKGKLFYLEYNIRLFLYLFFKKQDVICSVDLDTILAGFGACFFTKTKQVYDAHEYFTEVPEVVNRPFTKKIWERVAKFTIPRIKNCYTVGNCLAEIFEKRYGSPFEVIRNVNYQIASDNQLIPSDSKSFPKIILYQGALNEGRGIAQLIEVMAAIDGAELWLAGEGDLSRQLRERVKELNLESKVKFLGYVLPNRLPALTQQAYVGVNLLENKGLSYYYSLANKTFDYIQAQLPAIHMQFPEYERLNEKHEVAILIEDLKASSILNALNKLLDDKLLYDSLKTNCLCAAKEFNWEKEEQKLLTFYANLN